MSEIPSITVHELKAGLDANDDVAIIDVREPAEYSTCAIEGSILIPLSTLPDRLSELPKDKLLVMQCHHGSRSARATQFLLQHGHTNVVNLTGGIHAWTIEIDPNLMVY